MSTYATACVVQGYYQEAGRAGRDGARAECVLLFAARDCPRILNLMRRGKRSKFERGRAALQQACLIACSVSASLLPLLPRCMLRATTLRCVTSC